MKLTKILSATAVIAAMATAQPTFAQQQGGYGQQRGQGQAAAQQQAQQQRRAMQQQQVDIDVTDEMVKQYVDAREEVQSLSQKWQGKMGDMSAQEQQKLNQKLVKAVKSSGLSVEDYNAISVSMRQDSDLQKKVMNELN